ncbi:MAG: ABC transporter ATP-binding protein [Sulfolobales archaeon]
MTRDVIEVHQLTKRYGNLLAVDNVSFSVKQGEVFSLLGHNGAGKTTTVEIIACLRSATSGEVRVFGYDVRDEGQVRKIKRLIGVMPQEFNAIDRLTVEENVRLIAAIYGVKPDLKRLLEELGLWEYRKRLYMKLSGGLKRRVGIAMALVSDPELVFLDEPTTGLDVYARRETWRFIQSLKRYGKTVVLTTHYLEEAERLSDRVAIMLKGKIVALDSVEGLIRRESRGVRLILSGSSQNVEETLSRMGYEWIRTPEGRVIVSGLSHQEAASILSKLYESGYTGGAEMTHGGLEEAFLRLTGARLTETGDLA